MLRESGASSNRALPSGYRLCPIEVRWVLDRPVKPGDDTNECLNAVPRELEDPGGFEPLATRVKRPAPLHLALRSGSDLGPRV